MKEILLSKKEIKELLSPYKKDFVYVQEATIRINPPKKVYLKGICTLPPSKPTYLDKEINYVTATEGLALVTRCFILMFVTLLSRELLPGIGKIDEDKKRDPEVFTLRVTLDCKRKVSRKIIFKNGKPPGEKPIIVEVWLEEDWTVEERKGGRAFRGSIRFQIEESRWDGHVETFIWLENPPHD
jgi:hypothetical protein